MLASLASLILGALGKIVSDLVAEWRRDQALREAGARSVENAQLKEATDAVKAKAQVADDVARLSPDERRRWLQRWAKKD